MCKIKLDSAENAAKGMSYVKPSLHTLGHRRATMPSGSSTNVCIDGKSAAAPCARERPRSELGERGSHGVARSTKPEEQALSLRSCRIYAVRVSTENHREGENMLREAS